MQAYLAILLCVLFFSLSAIDAYITPVPTPKIRISTFSSLSAKTRSLSTSSSTTSSSTTSSVDSLTKFEKDCTNLISKTKGKDKSLPAWAEERGLTYTRIWSLEMWDRHVSRLRYFRHFFSLFSFQKGITNRIMPLVVLLGGWSHFVLHPPVNIPLLKKMNYPLASLALFSSFVAFLLTLRTNQAVGRLAEGRLAWGRTVLLTRDTANLLSEYVYRVNASHGLSALRHLSIFGFLLKARLREEDDSNVIKMMLPAVDAKFVMSQRKHPVALIMKIRQIVSYEARAGNLEIGAHMALENNLLELNRVYGMCERIRGSPIPPMYTRHTSRLLMFYLFTLPVALSGSGLTKCMSLVTTMIATFVMCGIDEIGVQIEQPFRIMPMKPLSAAVMRDVADALVCLPPPLEADDVDEPCRVDWLSVDCDEDDMMAKRYQNYQNANLDDSDVVMPKYWG